MTSIETANDSRPAILSESIDLRDHISRRYWSADRLGRLVAGSGILFCLAAGALCEAVAQPFLLGAFFIGLQLLVTALLGRCPMQRLMWRLGAKEREEIFADICRRS